MSGTLQDNNPLKENESSSSIKLLLNCFGVEELKREKESFYSDNIGIGESSLLLLCSTFLSDAMQRLIS